MAVTKVLPIKANLWYTVAYAANTKKTGLGNVIEYAVNPNKSEKRLLQSCLNCESVDTAYAEMKRTKEYWEKTDGVLGYHFIQSFKPGEVTAEQAHEIGIEFARECFGERFEVVIGTHLDKAHYHNHIVINSVSCVDGEKYHSSPESYYNRIRKVSDRMCEENTLSVITPKGRGKHYAEWKAEKEGKPTIRGQLCAELDEIIKMSYTMQEFWRNLEQRGYIIKRPEGRYKHPSVLPPFGKYPIRFDGLGKGYSLSDIQERIIAVRNGIRQMSPTEQKRQQYNLRGRPQAKKLHGFRALYFHYLYFFKLIRKKQTPQRVSFFMRDELVKLSRYQKQFKFLHTNGIETGTDLSSFRKECENKISELTNASENADKESHDEINHELRRLRQNMRMCDAIAVDAYRISEKYKTAKEYMKLAEKEMLNNEHKRRSR